VINIVPLNIVIVLFMLALVVYRGTRMNSVVVALIGVWLILLAGLRDGMGYDYSVYRDVFRRPEAYSEVMDLGFLALVHAFRILSDDYRFLFFCFSFITVLFVVLGARRMLGGDYLVPLVVYFLFPGLYFNAFSTVRQSLAMGVFFFAVSCYENKIIRYWFWVSVATLIHWSAGLAAISFVISVRIPFEKRAFLWLVGALLAHMALSVFGFDLSRLSEDGTKWSVYFMPGLWEPQSSIKILGMVVLYVVLFFDATALFAGDVKHVMRFILFGFLFFIVFSEFTPVIRLFYYSFLFVGIYLVWGAGSRAVRIPRYWLRFLVVILLGVMAQVNAAAVEKSNDVMGRIFYYRTIWN